ncbi:hypothetical protein EI613_18720 [Azospirillum sp. 412522]|nr:hypothetical protein [Azospirillum sp. 412522]MBY6263936.1 hypothetical protein [Azospirillum sp. 412522]
MGKHIVTKSFVTATRRFPVGRDVTERDIDGVLTLADRVRLGHVALVEAAAEDIAQDAAGTVSAG